MIAPALTRDEWRWLSLSTLSAVLGALAAEGVRYGAAELQRVQTERRTAAKAAEDESKARASIEAP